MRMPEGQSDAERGRAVAHGVKPDDFGRCSWGRRRAWIDRRGDTERRDALSAETVSGARDWSVSRDELQYIDDRLHRFPRRHRSQPRRTGNVSTCRSALPLPPLGASWGEGWGVRQGQTRRCEGFFAKTRDGVGVFHHAQLAARPPHPLLPPKRGEKGPAATSGTRSGSNGRRHQHEIR
jgi:hypothetical protein